MEHGTHCHLSTCNRLTFLPIRCPSCSQEHCEAHVQPDSHQCPSSAASSSTDKEVGSGQGGSEKPRGPDRAPCAFKGCRNKTLHVLPPIVKGSTSNSTTTTRASTSGFTHAAPACPRCKLMFCSSHASPTSHSCTSPAPLTEGDRKRLAAEERKRKAAETMARFRAAQAGKKK